MGIHNSIAVRIWLEKQAFRTMEWPAYSPDMNPIEHCWAHMKRIIYRNHPELITERIADARLQVELLAAILEAWEEISEDFLWELCLSMERRVAALIVPEEGILNTGINCSMSISAIIFEFYGLQLYKLFFILLSF